MTWLYAAAPVGVPARRVTALPEVDWYLQQQRLRVASIVRRASGLQGTLDPIYAFRFATFLPALEAALRRRCAEMDGSDEQRCDLSLEVADGEWVLRIDSLA